MNILKTLKKIVKELEDNKAPRTGFPKPTKKEITAFNKMLKCNKCKGKKVRSNRGLKCSNCEIK